MEPKKIDWSRPLQYGKHSARLLGEINDDEYPYVVAVDFNKGEEITKVNQYGQTYYWKGFVTNAPQRHVRWVNFYPADSGPAHETRKQADENAGPSRIACIRVEFEEGEGL